MTDNRTTELRKKLTERGIEYTTNDHMGVCETSWTEQVIAATLGRPKAKAHPYGYEPDTGAFDCTRCECGCINDVSAKYCNDCGGEIEVDMDAEKEIYRIPRNSVFAEKHDDGSLEFGGKRYIAATLGSERERELELLVKQLWHLVNHRSGYGYAAALESIEELGLEVD